MNYATVKFHALTAAPGPARGLPAVWLRSLWALALALPLVSFSPGSAAAEAGPDENSTWMPSLTVAPLEAFPGGVVAAAGECVGGQYGWASFSLSNSSSGKSVWFELPMDVETGRINTEVTIPTETIPGVYRLSWMCGDGDAMYPDEGYPMTFTVLDPGTTPTTPPTSTPPPSAPPSIPPKKSENTGATKSTPRRASSPSEPSRGEESTPSTASQTTGNGSAPNPGELAQTGAGTEPVSGIAGSLLALIGAAVMLIRFRRVWRRGVAEDGRPSGSL